MPTVLGVDPSLTCTGLYVLRSSGNDSIVTVQPKSRGMTRLVSHRDAFKAVVAAHEPELIAFEGYARGAATYREEMGELQGLLRVHTHDCGIPYIVVPPMSLKKFTTGSGGVDKNQMRLAVYKRWGFDSTGYPDDVADAYALAQFAMLYLSGSAPVSYQAEVIAKVKANPYGLAKGAA